MDLLRDTFVVRSRLCKGLRIFNGFDIKLELLFLARALHW